MFLPANKQKYDQGKIIFRYRHWCFKSNKSIPWGWFCLGTSFLIDSSLLEPSVRYYNHREMCIAISLSISIIENTSVIEFVYFPIERKCNKTKEYQFVIVFLLAEESIETWQTYIATKYNRINNRYTKSHLTNYIHFPIGKNLNSF